MPWHKGVSNRPPPEKRTVPQTVRLTEATADLVCQLAAQRRTSVYALLGDIIERVFEKQRLRHQTPGWYGEPDPPSTLSAVLSESPSRRARQSVS